MLDRKLHIHIINQAQHYQEPTQYNRLQRAQVQRNTRQSNQNQHIPGIYVMTENAREGYCYISEQQNIFEVGGEFSPEITFDQTGNKINI